MFLSGGRVVVVWDVIFRQMFVGEGDLIEEPMSLKCGDNILCKWVGSWLFMIGFSCVSFCCNRLIGGNFSTIGFGSLRVRERGEFSFMPGMKSLEPAEAW